MVKHITVNGTAVQVLNSLSDGPGTDVHTFELKGGSYVYRVADVWFLQERGLFKVPVTVGR
jgi:hypothetical protein